MMRTTCVATQLEGGHATNALPQLAAANVNCRLLPDDSIERVVAGLTKLMADDQVKITDHYERRRQPRVPLEA
jgi:acetylornithine deacetylase/succinyl-diaminopimelate desuccinylase-like protein